ncbi:trypsin-like serine protease [Streptomyces sp. NBC_01341]|uniref:trypsin-like serine protease n=1 Tax=Streptomyces sp. NBC_01341 TaxID=2903831 RepID=UPI002E0E42B2|nr:trypsin-like serine protease [Streptomyces sp. NBC_01341]
MTPISCAGVYSEPGAPFDTTGRFCAGLANGEKAVCNSDAGGPAVLGGVVVGITSGGGPGCDQPSPCSSASYFKRWLESQ